MTTLQKVASRVLAILKNEKSETVERAKALLYEGLRDGRKEKAERVAEFIAAETVEATGQTTVVVDLRIRFLNWLPREERDAWTRKKFCAELRKHKALKIGTANKMVALDCLLKSPGCQ